MFSGLIRDGISIHFDPRSNCYGEFIAEQMGTTDKYRFSNDGVEHNFYIYETECLLDLFGYQSFLGDSFNHRDARELFNNANSLVLDIDLDFFTYCNDGVYAKNRRDIARQITSDAFNSVWKKSKMITIALEPGFCGSPEDSREILDVFNEHVLRLKESDLTHIKDTFLRN